MDTNTILIVEDETIIGLDLQKRLEKFGYTVVDLVSTGRQAIAQASDARPGIVLMDIMLGGDIDGIEAATEIRKTLDIPIIFLTAFADDATLERAKQAEPFGYILKPFKERELYTTIEMALHKHAITQELKRQERWFQGILTSTGDGVIATARDNTIQFLNPVAEELTGWRNDEARNLDIRDVFVIADETSHARLDPTCLATGRSNGSYWYFSNTILVNKHGAEIHIEGNVATIREDNRREEGQVFAFRDVTQMRRMFDTINYQASHDGLTQLMNRERFTALLQEVMEQSRDERHCLIYLDIDNFKVVNDTCGQLAGDRFLIRVTEIIDDCLGRSAQDTGRLGSDEFGILLRNTDQEAGLRLAEQLRACLGSNPFLWQKSMFKIHASMGVVELSGANTDIHSTLAAAEDAASIAKEAGGNRIRVYEQANSHFVRRRGQMEWISRLTHALEDDRFCLYFHPIVPIAPMDEPLEKHEFLLRMLGHDGKIITPADFIPAAERYNLMPAVDRWVISHAFQSYPSLNGGSPGARRIFCINLSGASVIDETMLPYILNQLERHNVPPSAFCFEVTETAAIENFAAATTLIEELKAIGCTFSLDDFGSGFSSFTYLKRLPIDFLKIDGSYVKNILSDPTDRAMVEAINNIGHILGVRTIAEFVANEDIRQELIRLGVDFAQGFVYGPPRPIGEFSGQPVQP